MGGGPDLLARALAPRLSELWGQPLTVENHPGAAATAGPALVAKSPADGYTLLLNTSAQAYSVALSKDLPYDPLKDFIPVASLTYQPYVLVTGKSAGITTVRELIAAAKKKPGELKFGSTGAGTGTHLGIVRFNREAGIRGEDVPPQPTDGIADVLAATIEGRTTYMLAPISITLPHIHDGKLVPLGVTTARRSTLLPEVPTIAEAGLPGFEAVLRYGLLAPAGTPKDIVTRLNHELRAAVELDDVKARITADGGDVLTSTPEQYAADIDREERKWAMLVRKLGLKVE